MYSGFFLAEPTSSFFIRVVGNDSDEDIRYDPLAVFSIIPPGSNAASAATIAAPPDNPVAAIAVARIRPGAPSPAISDTMVSKGKVAVWMIPWHHVSLSIILPYDYLSVPT